MGHLNRVRYTCHLVCIGLSRWYWCIRVKLGQRWKAVQTFEVEHWVTITIVTANFVSINIAVLTNIVNDYWVSNTDKMSPAVVVNVSYWVGSTVNTSNTQWRSSTSNYKSSNFIHCNDRCIPQLTNSGEKPNKCLILGMTNRSTLREAPS